jgi:hypothetical protein
MGPEFTYKSTGYVFAADPLRTASAVQQGFAFAADLLRIPSIVLGPLSCLRYVSN